MASVDNIAERLAASRLEWANATWAYEMAKRKHLRVVHFQDKHWRPGKGNLYFQVKLVTGESLDCCPVWLSGTYSLPPDKLGETMHCFSLTAPVHHNKFKGMLTALGLKPLYITVISKREYERLIPK